PMLHWPDSMMTYMTGDAVLFSNDAFGQHYCDERLFNDEVDQTTINDLYPTAASGDLTVEVKESDGSINRYNVPYSAVPILQREG
ncbi:fimbria/pilus outer membrane usher protein, partial [Salmonella enterica subsp. enterica serovar Montevideo]|nr:fimbria/pilus outer membrane usher protein [Salmonella enterica subsp. enterica serovar Montevideo]